MHDMSVCVERESGEHRRDRRTPTLKTVEGVEVKGQRTGVEFDPCSPERKDEDAVRVVCCDGRWSEWE